MTTDSDFDRITMAWLAEGPEELPDRVIDAAVDQIHLIRQRRGTRPPWRLPTMTMPARLAALIAVGALLLAGVAVVGGGRTAPTPTRSATPSAAAIAPPAGLPVFDTSFISPRHGYGIRHPAGWTVLPATQSWQPGTTIRWGDSTLDAVQTTDARFAGAGQRLATGETAAQWFKAYCLGTDKDAGQCDSVPTSWEPVKIAGSDGYIDLDGVDAWPGTIAPGGKVFDAVIVNGTTAWAFTLDGDVDRATFDAFLDKISLFPASLVSMPRLNGRFTSPTNGFSIGTAADWTPSRATQRWHGLGNPSEVMDGIDITGTDTAVGGASQSLGKQTFADYLSAYHADSVGHVPSGCDGGDPSRWPEIRIGDKVGRLQMQCNAADAFVEAGGRVYIFEWGNETFETDRHFPLEAWKELLRSVKLDPGSAK
ncbi:MAG: hypothetical protein ACJ77V_11155 [Chloroflexota bacterium]